MLLKLQPVCVSLSLTGTGRCSDFISNAVRCSAPNTYRGSLCRELMLPAGLETHLCPRAVLLKRRPRRTPACCSWPPLRVAILFLKGTSWKHHGAWSRQGRNSYTGGLARPTGRGYTTGMKTAISLPDDVFQAAERHAKRVRKSRSQLYSEALAEYLARHAPDEVIEAMNRVVEQLGEPQADPFLAASTRRVFQRTEW